MKHFFNVGTAMKVGLNSAVLLNSLYYWCEKNKCNNKNFHDGLYWTYNSTKAFSKYFPYMTAKQIRTSLEALIRDGYILKGNFNENLYDRTSWYAITKKGILLLDEEFSEEDYPEESHEKAPDDSNSEIISQESSGSFLRDAENIGTSTDSLNVKTNENTASTLGLTSRCSNQESISEYTSKQYKQPFAPQGKWSCPTGQMDLPCKTNGFALQDKAIPYSKTNSNTCNISIYQSSNNTLKTSSIKNQIDGQNESFPMETADSQSDTTLDYLACYEKVKTNLNYDEYLFSHPSEKDILDEVVDLITELLLVPQNIEINRKIYPHDLVKRKLLKLNDYHISYVFEALKEASATKKITNMRNYLIACLLNSLTTANLSIESEVQYDMYQNAEKLNKKSQSDTRSESTEIDYDLIAKNRFLTHLEKM